MKLFTIVFVNTLLSYSIILYVRYKLIESIIGTKAVKFIIEWYFNKYKGWKVYVGWNGHGFSIFNRNHVIDQFNLKDPENWYCKTIVPWWLIRVIK